MKSVNATKFKEQCLALLDSLEPDGIIVTKRGTPVAKVIPIETDCAELIGSMKDQITINGDILSTGLRWDAES